MSEKCREWDENPKQTNTNNVIVGFFQHFPQQISYQLYNILLKKQIGAQILIGHKYIDLMWNFGFFLILILVFC